MQIAYRPPVTNSLLAALPHKDYQHLFVYLEVVPLTFGEVVYLPGEPIRYVYFPTNSLVSLLTQVEGHQALEVGMVGHEGMLGIPLVLGVNNSPVHALVHGAGMTLRMTSAHFHQEFQHSACLRREVYHYIYGQLSQLTQTAACNRFHHVEARLASRLLMMRDRLRSNRFHLTHDLLGDMLGVRRVGITKAANDLRQRKLISYNRGDIHILDESGLEATACPCYQTTKDMHQAELTRPDSYC